jgi:hypothetical protein
MLGNKQEQSASEGSVALQAAGDIHYNGLSLTEVRELCLLVLQNNFPKLREEAKQTAEQYVREFATILENKLVDNAASIVLEKFREPDVQALINDAVQASARKGQAASPEILSSLIAERVTVKSNEYTDIVLSEAVNVVPKLTTRQISFLSFHHAVLSINLKNHPGFEIIEQLGQKTLPFCEPGFGLSYSQRQHIQYTGACSINELLGGDIYERVRDSYAHLEYSDNTVFKKAVALGAPSFGKLLDQFEKENLFAVQLTSVGQAIAIANISNPIGKMDYSIWLN